MSTTIENGEIKVSPLDTYKQGLGDGYATLLSEIKQVINAGLPADHTLSVIRVIVNGERK